MKSFDTLKQEIAQEEELQRQERRQQLFSFVESQIKTLIRGTNRYVNITNDGEFIDEALEYLKADGNYDINASYDTSGLSVYVISLK